MSDLRQKSIRIIPNGPLRVSGAPLYRLKPGHDAAGRPVRWNRGASVDSPDAFSLCRCGESANKPFCDGTHKSNGFTGTETADRAPTSTRREKYAGPEIVMTDDKTLCCHAGFCVREHAKAWTLVETASDMESRETLIGMIENCPTGRLEYYAPPDETPIERTLEQEVGIIKNGPLWVTGGIPIEDAEGETYEVRNRVALCRCGASANKPFCDGAHLETHFDAD
jgi:CDGSH-type Zn-finger protein